MSFGPESHNPRERRAYAHATIAKYRKTGTCDDYNHAAISTINAGTSRKSLSSLFESHLIGATRHIGDNVKNVLILDKAASDATYEDWVKNGKKVNLPTAEGGTCLEHMIKEGEKRIDIVVPNKFQIVSASLYREGSTPKKNHTIDVRIVVDPNIRIPTGGLREGNRRVIIYNYM